MAQSRSGCSTRPSQRSTRVSHTFGDERVMGVAPFPSIATGDLHVYCNLNNFLCVARRNYPKRRFWIEAICIDQANKDERSHQVQQMGEIYSRAKEVIVWLGDSKLAADYIPWIDSRARHPFRYLPYDIGRKFWVLVRISIPCVSTRKKTVQQNAFDDAARQYWSRAWVIQEVTVAKHVCLLVHETELNLTTLKLTTMECIRPTLQIISPIYEANTQDRNGHNRYLLKLLSEYGRKICQDPRDRIYSLRSISVDGADLRVDYDLSEEKFLSTVLKASRLAPCLCSAHAACRSIPEVKVDAISRRAHVARYFVMFTVQARDVYTYRATQRKRQSCCSSFSAKSFVERSDGQLFYLSNVCTLMKWHLFVVSREPHKPHVKAVMCRSSLKDSTSLSLGENGTLVEICTSPRVDSYTIKFNFKASLKLPTMEHSTFNTLSRLLVGNMDHSKWQDLCAVARQIGGNSSVEYLDLGP